MKGDQAIKGLRIGCLICIGTPLVLIAGCLLVSLLVSPNGGQSAARYASGDWGDKVSAQAMAQQFVRDHLKCPSTASFGSVFGEYQKAEDNVEFFSNGSYKVTGWVDAQNAFGAMVRTRFECGLRPCGNDRWHLIFLFLDDEPVYADSEVTEAFKRLVEPTQNTRDAAYKAQKQVWEARIADFKRRAREDMADGLTREEQARLDTEVATIIDELERVGYGGDLDSLRDFQRSITEWPMPDP